MRKYVLYLMFAVILIGALFFVLRPGDKTANKLEIFSWWTATGEEEGLNELYHLYQKKNPEVDIINATVVGGAGFNAQSVLETRMAGGNPPDSFQVLAGPGLMNTWIKPGYLEDLSSIYIQKDLLKKFPKEIIDKFRYRSGIYAIPINIHRDNVLWYNMSIFERYNIQPPKSKEDLIAVMNTLAEHGVTPLALGNKNQWPASHLFETIVVANLGAEKYNGLWNGHTPWNSKGIRAALQEFIDVLDYINSDHASLTWDEAVQYVIDGKCAMTVMGDFAEGYLKAKGLRPNIDFGWVPYPGTRDVFIMNSDTFVLPKGAVHRQNAIEWLKLVSSQAGQDAFNPKKGSIPARSDSRKKKNRYDDYQKSALQAFKQNTRVDSFTHGAIASDKWRSELNKILDQFIVEKEIPKTLEILETTSSKY